VASARVRRSRAILIWFVALVGFATAVRLIWVLSVPTVPVSDFAMYRESANYLSEFGRLDPGFIYMPGFVALLAAIKNLGGDLLAQKLLGVFFGALGAAGLFVVTWKLVDEPFDEDDGGAGGAEAIGWRRICPCPHAALAAAIYALWPAGVAMSSVVGTDVPAAALIITALALLVTFGRARPWTAALAFGAAMGLAAWVRAVALPLSALSLGYWLALRLRIGRAIVLTAVGLAAALLVLSPWAIRHLRQSGSLYFTDDHGGITALIGANPNSEGTYTRALNRLFQDVTGRGVLDEPHHTTDQAAYAIVREWTRFEPRYTLGMITLKADRLFDPEIRLLYWPIFRPGALVGPDATWFAAHHGVIASVADAFGLSVMGLTLAGIAVALARRRWMLLALLPFQLALAATYAIFFAEPRYRLPLEMLAFPFVALALGEIAALGLALARRPRGDVVRAARALAAALVLVVLWRIVWPAVLEGGRRLRAHHRWAATEAAFQRPSETGTRLLLWRPTAPFSGTSPIEGAPSGLHLRVGDEGGARVQVRLGGGPVGAGTYVIAVKALNEAAEAARLSFANGPFDLPPGSPTEIEVRVTHAGGPLALEVALAGSPGASIWLTDARIVAFDNMTP
jgi:4-amino-4-deoxy-L-arabinose transferase-like glycosyltransferase